MNVVVKEISPDEEYELRKTMTSDAWFAAQKSTHKYVKAHRRPYTCLIDGTLYLTVYKNDRHTTSN
jgi:hypothetical protein